MKNSIQYPRVLIIYNSCINKSDQHGVSIRGWFGNWPKENLAQIYSGGEVGSDKFCGYNFKLGNKERRFGNLFYKLKESSIGQSSSPILLDENFTKLNKLNFWSLLKNKASELLINTGLWELIFKPLISKEMMDFINSFNPQIIYCQGYHLTFAWLPVMIHEKYQLPICFQTGDDWPSFLYSESPFSFVTKPIVRHSAKSLLVKSTVRLANGKLMENDFRKRYGLSFETLMMCDDINRFTKVIPQSVVDSGVISIIYTGSLGLGRWISIVDLCKAAQLLQKKGLKIIISVFTNAVPNEAVNTLQDIVNLQIFPGPSHEELPSFLKGADILYLPETFDPVGADLIRLSISTKAHLYMMSEKPVLIYASPITGIVHYAKETNWACIVEEQNVNNLAQALLKMITDNAYCKNLVIKGLEVAYQNHDEIKVKGRLLTLLSETVENNFSRVCN